MQATDAVFVADEGQSLSIRGEVEFIDVRLEAVSQEFVLLGGEIDIGEPLKL